MKRYLNQHIRRVHINDKHFKCELCDYAASSESNLKQHTKSAHIQQKDFMCELCDYATSTKGHIKSHIKISHNKQEEMTICNYDNHMCFGGCRTACKHRLLSAEIQYQPNILEKDNQKDPEILVKDCILYWHFDTTKRSETNLVMYQIYGKDVSGTWFDLGQTTKSYFENLPSILDKCKAIRILFVDPYSSLNFDFNLDQNNVKDQCDVVKNTARFGKLIDAVDTKPLFHSSLEQENQIFSNFTIKVVIVLALCLLLVLLILLSIVVYRIKRKRNEKLNSSSRTGMTENSYEEIGLPDTNNLNFGAYNVQRGRVTSTMNNHRLETPLTVSLPNKENRKIFEKSSDTRNLCCPYKDKMCAYQKESINKYDPNPGKDFVDVVSWLRTVNSEMHFDTFGFNNQKRQSNLNMYPLKYYHIEMSQSP